jgi:NADPH:quinone reductase
MACAMNILRRAHIMPGETVALVGFGFLGRLLLPLLLGRGARVIVLTHHEEGRAFAVQSGATIPAGGEPAQWLAGVRELTGDGLCEAVIETAGTQAAITLGGELTRVRGRLIIAGYHQDGSREVNMQLWNWRGIDVINAHERDPAVYLEGMRLAWAAVVSGQWNLSGLISHRFPLDDLSSALAAAAKREPGFTKAVISI